MRKLIAGINMTLDGVCDHTSMIADEEIHDHYTELLNEADAILYGRITYQLMGYWQTVLENPSKEKSMNDFAKAIDKIQKIVFSRTLKDSDPIAIGWKTATLATGSIEEEILKLKQQPGKDILVGSRSLIIQLMNLNLIDEFQLCVQPIIAGSGLALFENISDRINLTLLKTKIFSASGSVLFYYEPTKA
jgi:dihydrofolate reductase